MMCYFGPENKLCEPLRHVVIYLSHTPLRQDQNIPGVSPCNFSFSVIAYELYLLRMEKGFRELTG